MKYQHQGNRELSEKALKGIKNTPVRIYEHEREEKIKSLSKEIEDIQKNQMEKYKSKRKKLALASVTQLDERCLSTGRLPVRCPDRAHAQVA